MRPTQYIRAYEQYIILSSMKFDYFIYKIFCAIPDAESNFIILLVVDAAMISLQFRNRSIVVRIMCVLHIVVSSD